MPDHRETMHQRLLAAYHALPAFERLIVQLCSVIYDPTDKAALIKCLFKAEISTNVIKREMVRNLSPSLVHLQRLGFLNEKLQCEPAFVEIASREALKERHFHLLATAVQEEVPKEEALEATLGSTAPSPSIRDIRIDLYSNNIERFHRHLLAFYETTGDNLPRHPIVTICNTPFDPVWFSTLPLHLQFFALHEILKQSLINLEPIEIHLQFLQTPGPDGVAPIQAHPSFAYLFISHLLLKGQVEEARRAIAEAGESIASFGLRGWLHFMVGDNQTALHYFASDLAMLRRMNETETAYYTGPEGLIYSLARLKTNDSSHFAALRQVSTSLRTLQPNNIFRASYTILQLVLEFLENRKPHTELELLGQRAQGREADAVFSLFQCLATYWIKGRLEKKQRTLLANLFEVARRHGYDWLALQYAELLFHTERQPVYQEYIETIRTKTGMISVLSSLDHEEPWQRALKALNLSAAPERLDHSLSGNFRLIWLLRFAPAESILHIQPKEQKRTGSGTWTKGRTLSLKSLATEEKSDFFTDQDLRVCAAIKYDANSTWPEHYCFDLNHALPALIGHPHLYLEQSPLTHLELLKGQPELIVDQRGDLINLRFIPPVVDEKVKVLQETPTRFKVIEITREHHRIASIIGEEGLNVPLEAKEQILATLGNVSALMTIHSAIGGSGCNIQEVEADSQIHIHLLPVGSGFRVAMFVKPFGAGGPYLKPGAGSENLFAEINGERLQTKRDLGCEESNASEVEASCPPLALQFSSEREWLLPAPEDCLQLLLALKQRPNTVVEWPEGEKIRISQQVSFKQLKVKIRSRHDWFAIDGELQLDDHEVLGMKKLIELVRSSNSRFLPLGEGQFLALTKELHQRLEELNSYAELKEEGLLIHPLAAPALNDLIETGLHLEADQDWHRHCQRFQEAALYQPTLPSTLQAELRDYQIEGYKWLARLAYWGVGACLADDMGLGKTVQALAAVLDQAQEGPSLIIAPTSVCMNWQEEANRFAPTLNVILFGGKNRRGLVNDLKSFDVLVASYGFLQQEPEILTDKEWQVVILDEAQAIKNLSTKRSQAAMTLKGKFRLITTGTPIENHLGELWNLFNFINPGLLGTLRQFNDRFAAPIEKYQSREARQQLKKLIQPFILRRVKNQVLSELPPRTEIILKVDMSKEETAFYEALRQQALERLEKGNTAPGHKHLQIFAEIMKLRQACCNPKLVMPASRIESSKLELFGKIVADLLENKHKALVFSQFVGHLAILRAYLEQQGIDYRYLDGTTTPRQRQKQISDFQAGHGDLFLISLKAGGVGLNLTAADYVLHMDPWWNPAVEDQASDRAHRIGQLLPVTIYRLVTRNTIEEKIVKLHHAKKDLATSLLDGTDMSGKMTTEELLTLIREQ